MRQGVAVLIVILTSFIFSISAAFADQSVMKKAYHRAAMEMPTRRPNCKRTAMIEGVIPCRTKVAVSLRSLITLADIEFAQEQADRYEPEAYKPLRDRTVTLPARNQLRVAHAKHWAAYAGQPKNKKRRTVAAYKEKKRGERETGYNKEHQYEQWPKRNFAGGFRGR